MVWTALEDASAPLAKFCDNVSASFILPWSILDDAFKLADTEELNCAKLLSKLVWTLLLEASAPVAKFCESVSAADISEAKEPVSAFNAANWSATAPPPEILIAPSTVKVLPSQTNLSPKLNLLPLST